MKRNQGERRRKLLSGQVSFPDRGRVVLFSTGLDFLAREAQAAVGADRVLIVERNLRSFRTMQLAFPDCDVLHAAHPPTRAGDFVIMPLLKNRVDLFRELHSAATSIGKTGKLVVYGEKREGMGPAQALLAEHCELADPHIKAGGRMLTATPRTPAWNLAAFEPEYKTELRGKTLRVACEPGIFSWNELDEASKLLIETARCRPDDRLLDLGCGCGVVAAALLQAAQVASATLCDADALALDCARRTLGLNGLDAQLLAADAGDTLPDRSFDLILCNPPRHESYSTRNDLAGLFFLEAERLLAPRGRLLVVGPPDAGDGAALERIFGPPTLVAESGRARVWQARAGSRTQRRALRREREE